MPSSFDHRLEIYCLWRYQPRNDPGHITSILWRATKWKSVKYEEVYLHAYDSVAAAKAGIQRYFSFYNNRRPHSSLDRQTPDHVYFDSQPLAAAA